MRCAILIPVLVASLSLGTVPMALAAAPAEEPSSPTWGNIDGDKEPSWDDPAPTPTPGAGAIPQEVWSSMIGKDVVLTLANGQTVAGNLMQDNGGSVTMVAPDQSVGVVNKANVTGLKLLSGAGAGAPPADRAGVAAGAGQPVDTSGKTKEQLIQQELRSGPLSSKYKKAKQLTIIGAVLTPLSLLMLVPGVLFLDEGGDKKDTGILLTALGGTFVFVGLVALAIGLGQTSKVKSQARAKYSFTVAPNLTRGGAGLGLVGRF